MKQVNEEWQMRIFDLLEGNLSKEEAIKVLSEIEKDDALMHEYRLMQKTYLAPEFVQEETFLEKAALYRKAGGIFTFQKNIFKYAAAAVIFIAVTIAFKGQFISKKQDAFVSQAPLSSPKISADKNENAKNKGSINFQENINMGEEKIQSNTAGIWPRPRLTQKTAPIIPAKEALKDTTINEVKYAAIDIESMPTKGLGNEVSEIRIADPVAFDQLPYQGMTLPVSKRRSLRYKLQNASKVMLAFASKPKVKVITTKQENHLLPKVELKLSNSKVDIIATVIE